MRFLAGKSRPAVSIVFLGVFALLGARQLRAEGGVITGRVDFIWPNGVAPCTNMVMWDVWRDPISTNTIRRRSTRTDGQGRFEFRGLTNSFHFIYTDAWNSSTNNVADRWFSPICTNLATNAFFYVPRDLQGNTDWYNIPRGLDGYNFIDRPLHTNYAEIILPPGGVIEGKIENQSGTAIDGGGLGAFSVRENGNLVNTPRAQSDSNGLARIDKLWPGKFFPYTYTSTNVYDQYHPGVEYFGPPTPSGMPQGAQSVDVNTGSTASITFSLRNADNLDVRFMTTNSMPLPDVRVSVRDIWGDTVSTEDTTDASGEATITKIKPGTNYLFGAPSGSSGCMYEYWGGRFTSTNEIRGEGDTWVYRQTDPPPHNAEPIIVHPNGSLGTNTIATTVDPFPQLTVTVRNGNTGGPVTGIRVTAHGSEGQSYGWSYTDGNGTAEPKTIPGYTYLDGWRNEFVSTNIMSGYVGGVSHWGDEHRVPDGATPVLTVPGRHTDVTLDLFPGAEQDIIVRGDHTGAVVRVLVDGVQYHWRGVDASGVTTAIIPSNSTAWVSIDTPTHMSTVRMSHAESVYVETGDNPLVIDMPQGQTLDGRILFETDGPAVAAEGSYVSVYAPNALGGYNSAYAFANPDGTFTVNGLPAGTTCTLDAYPGNMHGFGMPYLRSSGTILILEGAPWRGTATKTIVLPRGSWIEGNLGVEGIAVVGVDAAGESVDEDVTASDGAFALLGKADGELYVRTVGNDVYPSAWIGPSGATVATSSVPTGQAFDLPAPGETTNAPPVALPRGPGALRFHVTADRHGNPVSGAEAVVSTPDGFTIAEAAVPSHGNVTISGLPADTPLAVGAHCDGYTTVWYPAVPGSDDITDVPAAAGTIVLTGGGLTNDVSLPLQEPGPGPLISDVSPLVVDASPNPATIGMDNVTTTFIVSNAGPHMATIVDVLIPETTGACYSASGGSLEDGGPTVELGRLYPGASLTGTVDLVVMATGLFEVAVAATPGGFDPDASNNVRQFTLEGLDAADDDGDGIPNWFETAHSGSATGMAPGGDGDFDLIINLDEWLQRSDPSVPNAPFGIQDAKPNVDGGISFDIPTREARAYIIYRSRNLRDAPIWTRLGTVGGSGERISIHDPNGGTQAWYRAAAQAP